jgi:hypothetical protein
LKAAACAGGMHTRNEYPMKILYPFSGNQTIWKKRDLNRFMSELKIGGWAVDQDRFERICE